jgi:hypothetical protein
MLLVLLLEQHHHSGGTLLTKGIPDAAPVPVAVTHGNEASELSQPLPPGCINQGDNCI